MDAHERLVRLLDSRGAEFRLIHHAGVRAPRWSAVSCRVVSISGPGQVSHVLAVVPGGQPVAMGVLRTMWAGTGAFPAPRPTVEALTGGSPVPFTFRADLALVVDRVLLAEREIIFAAQRPDVSVGLATFDYVRLARPSVADLTRTATRPAPGHVPPTAPPTAPLSEAA